MCILLIWFGLKFRGWYGTSTGNHFLYCPLWQHSSSHALSKVSGIGKRGSWWRGRIFLFWQRLTILCFLNLLHCLFPVFLKIFFSICIQIEQQISLPYFGSSPVTRFLQVPNEWWYGLFWRKSVWVNRQSLWWRGCFNTGGLLWSRWYNVKLHELSKVILLINVTKVTMLIIVEWSVSSLIC